MSCNPKVSMLVPVYNAGEFLRRFMDSVLQQSFQDYELICVDNWSTDNSLEVLKEYQKAFPDKVFVYQTDEHGGVGKGRNTALRHARGEYVFWCDSDDIVHPLGIDQLYNEAQKYDADIVVGWAKTVIQDETGQVTKVCDTSKKCTQAVSNDSAIMSGAEFWLRLIRKSLLDDVGFMLETVVFDDISYLPVVQSRAKTIRYINFPVYYFFRRTNSTCTVATAKVSHDSVTAEKYALENCAPEHRKAVERFVAHRIRFNLDFRWQYYDVYIEWLKELMPSFSQNDYITSDKALYQRLQFASSLTDNKIPPIVYIDGFKERPSDERIAELEEKVFHEGSKVVVLSENNCNINENEYVAEAYRNGDYDTVSGYFALKNIYENGGFFIHKSIRVINCFNSCKFHNAVFALIDKDTYSDRVFGAPANNPVYEDLLKTYSVSWDKKKRYMSLSERIAIILSVKYDIPFNGMSKLFGDTVSVLSPDMCTIDTRFGIATKRTICEHDFSDVKDSGEYITVKRSTLKTLLEDMPVGGVSKQQLQANNNAAEELRQLKQTNTYKIMMKIRKLGDGPIGPFLKKIFHGLLKIREKFKRK